jgi:hypothetical protein
VDELPELEDTYSTNSIPKSKPVSASDITTPQSTLLESPNYSAAALSTASPQTPPSFYSNPLVVTPHSKRRRTNESDTSSFHSSSGIISDQDIRVNLCPETARVIEGALIPDEDGIDSILKAADISQRDPSQQSTLIDNLPPTTGNFFRSSIQEIQPESPGIWPHTSVQEACLMRYFIDELACWVRRTPI